jgi:hypothetical protein
MSAQAANRTMVVLPTVPNLRFTQSVDALTFMGSSHSLPSREVGSSKMLLPQPRIDIARENSLNGGKPTSLCTYPYGGFSPVRLQAGVSGEAFPVRSSAYARSRRALTLD